MRIQPNSGYIMYKCRDPWQEAVLREGLYNVTATKFDGKIEEVDRKGQVLITQC
jgi:hypothetical protein